MNPNKALWEKGDFTEIAAFMRQSGEAVVDSLAIKPPLKVLDLGCGDGTTALPLARLGADVSGIDIARNLVEAGNRRAAKAGLTRLKFQEGDACNLEGVANDSFDLTISIFGAMFAPKPFDVAKEMVRVTKPGGRIVMGNWIPGDPTFVAQILRISSSYSPPPPEGFVSPMTWGMEDKVTERFAAAGIPAERIDVLYELDMHYLGQTHTVAVPLPVRPDDNLGVSETNVRAAFEAAYLASFSRLLPGLATRIVSLRVAAVGRRPKFDFSVFAPDAAASLAAAKRGARRVWFNGFRDTAVWSRLELPAMARIEGPAILEQPDATTVIEPGLTGRTDRLGNLLVELAG